jgi:hypothetical protein
MHLLFDFAEDGMETSEIYVLSNAGERTVKDAVTLEDGQTATLAFPSPARMPISSFSNLTGRIVSSSFREASQMCTHSCREMAQGSLWFSIWCRSHPAGILLYRRPSICTGSTSFCRRTRAYPWREGTVRPTTLYAAKWRPISSTRLTAILVLGNRLQVSFQG